jgi:hypothetical protein
VQQAWGDCPSPLPLDRFLSDAVAGAGNVSIALTLGVAARDRASSSSQSPRSSLCTPRRRFPGARLAPHASSALPADRLGSQKTLTARWKPPDATACSPLGPACAESPLRHECQSERRRTPARAPKNSRRTEAPTGTRRIRAAIRSTQRPESSTLPPTVTRRDRWAETTCEKACRTGLGATPGASCRGARPDTVQRIHSSPPRPKTEQLGATQPTAGIVQRSEVRRLLTLPSCSKVLPPSRHLCRLSLANSLATRDRKRRRRLESPLCRRNPERRADAQRPPCGGLPTPELARSTQHRHPTELVARG